MVWTNGAGGDWDTASNWVNSANSSDHHVPIASDNVQINISGITVTHTTSAFDSVNSLTVASGTTLSLTGGTLSIAAASTINGTFNLAGGTLTGAGNLTVVGALNWSANSTMSGGGQTVAQGTTTIDADGSTAYLVGRTLLNQGTMTWDGYYFRLYSGAAIVNAAGATFDADAAYTIVNQDGSSPSFTNAGTLDGQDGSGSTATIGVAFTNTGTGTVDVQSGGLSLDVAGTETGTFLAAAGATLGLDGGGTAALDSNSSVTGSGTVEFNSSVTELGTYDLGATGGTKVDGGTVSFPGAVAGLGGTLTVNGGSVTFLGTIPAAGPAVTIDGGGTANFSSNNLTIPSLNLAGGTLTGSAVVTVSGALSWSGNSTMSGGGQTVAQGTTTIDADGSTAYLVGRTLLNQGTMTWDGYYFRLYSGAAIVNAAGATFDADAAYTIVNQDGSSPSFTNAGTLDGQDGSGSTATIGVAFTNTGTGTVDAQSGGLSLDVAGTETGTFLAAAGATLGLDGGGTAALDSNSSVTGSGTVEFNSSVTELGTYDLGATGGTKVDGGTVSFPGAVAGLGGTLTVNGGTANFLGTIPAAGPAVTIDGGGTANFSSNSLTIPSLNLAGGTLTGSAVVTVAGALSWSGNSAMSGGGQTVAQGTTTIDADGSTAYLVGRTLLNQGTMTWDGYYFRLYSGAAIVNAAGATFDADTAYTIVNQDGSSPSFTNAGTLDGQDGSGSTATIGVAFTNTGTGTVNVQSGGLSLDVAGTETGTFLAAAGATLGLDGGGTAALDSNSSVTGSGTVEFNSSVTELGTYDLGATGGTKVDGGTVSFPGAVAGLGGTLTVNGGSVTFLGTIPAAGPAVTIDGGGTANFSSNNLTVPSLNLAGGTLTGSAVVTVSGALSWSAASTMSGGGQTIAQGTTTIDADGSQAYLVGRTLVNDGTMDWYGSVFRLYSSAAIVNAAGATFNTNTGAEILNQDGSSPSFTNSGTIDGLQGNYTATIGVAFTNTSIGTVDAQSGGLEFSGSSTFAGTVEATGGGSLTMATPPTNLVSGTLTGATWIVGSNSSMTLGANITTDAANIILSGSTSPLIGQGGGDALATLADIAAGGSFTIENGRSFTAALGLSNAGDLTIGAGSTLNGNLDQVGGQTNVLGTLNGANTTPTPPDQGSALAFDGAKDYATVPDQPSLRLNNSVTIEFWAKRGAVRRRYCPRERRGLDRGLHRLRRRIQ